MHRDQAACCRTLRLSWIGIFCFLLATNVAAQVDFDSIRFDPATQTNRPGDHYATGDFNGDGITDVAVADEDDHIDIYLHDGASRYRKQDPPIAAEWTGIVVKVLAQDFDSDGSLDLVIAQSRANRLYFYRGDGNGGFQLSQTVDDLEDRPFGAVATDFDVDGNLDIVTTSGLILLGDGTGDFTPLPRTPFPGSIGLQVDDLDANGRPDVVVLAGFQDLIYPVLADATGSLDGLISPPRSRHTIRDFVTGDFNEDGVLDLAAAEGLLLGDGTGGFGPPISLPDLDGFLVASAADFNQDGHLDLLADVWGLQVMLGDGQAGFTAAEYTPFLDSSSSPPAIGDIDGDGNPDILAVEYFERWLMVFRGRGDGSFDPPVNLWTQTGYEHIAAADFDGDSNLDVALTQGGRFEIFYGNGNVEFPVRTLVEQGGGDQIVVADFNEDGSPDIAVGGPEPTRVFLNDTEGGFIQSETLEMENDVDLKAIDVDDDGHIDLVSVGSGMSVAKGTGTGVFTDLITYRTPSWPAAVQAGDFDGDGITDIMQLALFGFYLSEGDADGKFSPIHAIPAPGGPAALASADVNGDGRIDLVTADGEADTLSVYVGDGTGGFSRDATYPTIETPEILRLADFDADGHLDAAVIGQAGAAIHFGDAQGSFADTRIVNLDAREAHALHEVAVPSRVTLGALVVLDDRLATIRFDAREPLDGTALPIAPPPDGFSTASGLAKADLNGDTHLDVIHADADESIHVVLGDGEGGFTLATTVTLSNLGVLATGDFNEDGNPDVAIGRSREVLLLLGDGNGDFAPGARLPLGSQVDDNPRSIVVGDVDLDGHLDLVVAVPGDPRPSLDGRVWVFLGNGTGSFPQLTTVNGVREPHDTVIGSFNDRDDGHVDLLILDHGIAGVTFARGNGVGSFVREASFPLEQPQIHTKIAMGDFNRDGHLDAVVSGERPSSEVRFGSGFGTFPDSLSIDGRGDVKARDLNGDRQIDLLFAGTGTIALGNGRGDFSPPQVLLQGVEFREVGAATSGFFDGDSLLDIVILSEDKIRFHRNRSFEVEQCLLGNTNAIEGFHVDALEVNGSPGDPSRFLPVESTEGLRVTLNQAPQAAVGGAYYAAIWNGSPQDSTTAVLPASLGFACFQPIRTELGYAPPLFVANTIRPDDPRLDPPGPTATGIPGNALPGVVLDLSPSDLPRIGTYLTVQALVGDRNALGRKSVSLTNGIVVRIE